MLKESGACIRYFLFHVGIRYRISTVVSVVSYCTRRSFRKNLYGYMVQKKDYKTEYRNEFLTCTAKSCAACNFKKDKFAHQLKLSPTYLFKPVNSMIFCFKLDVEIDSNTKNFILFAFLF